ncbi:MAG: hypothetical protein II124_07025 [Clostridia bacterium]|nr:hypothetical protein [Clostridia bacterium]
MRPKLVGSSRSRACRGADGLTRPAPFGRRPDEVTAARKPIVKYEG